MDYIHRQALVCKSIPEELSTTLSAAVKIVNFIKSRATNSRLFRARCGDFASSTILYFTQKLDGFTVSKSWHACLNWSLKFKHFDWSSVFIIIIQLNGLQGAVVTIFSVRDQGSWWWELKLCWKDQFFNPMSPDEWV